MVNQYLNATRREFDALTAMLHHYVLYGLVSQNMADHAGFRAPSIGPYHLTGFIEPGMGTAIAARRSTKVSR